MKSDTITVKADGTSVINVYYDRTSFTMTFKEEGNNGKTLGTITDKWGASIRTRFETISTNNTFFWSENKNGGSPWTSFVDIMPEKNMTYYADPQTGSTTLTATYLGQTLNGGEEYEALYTVSFKGSSTITVSKEEFVPIKGYIFNEDKSSKIGNYYNGAKFYYDRASFKLEFNNGKEIVNTVTPLYEQPLTQYESFVPRSPEKYEPGSVVFAGWYMNPECSGQEYVLSTQKMPAENLILYAKWEPVMHDVTVYRFRNSDGTFPDGEDILVETMQIPHGQFVQEQYIPEDPEHGRYAFDGWFYIDEDGKEQAFSFRDIPVTQDMQIYAKWSSHVPYPYEIRFVLASDPTVAVADPITGSILQGSKTFEAKGGDALYEQYREGYFPHVKSHTVYIELDDENGEDVAVYIFKYTEVAKVPYTVRYLIVNDDGSTRPAFVATADGGYRPADDETETGQEYIKTVPENAKAVVTETYVAIDGYLPINNEYQKTLVVTPDGNNEIIFYYKADNKHALVQRNHYIQTLGGGWKEYQASTTTEDLNKIYSESAIEISHYTFSDQLTQKYNLEDKKDAYLNADLPGTVDFDPETNTVSGTLTSSGLQLNLYYVPNTYTYTVKYLELNTLIELEDTKEEQVLYGTLVTEDAVEIEKDLDGDGKFENFRLYEASQERQEVTILNDSTVITFYYVRCTQDLTVTKTLEDKNPGDSYAPDWNMSFNFRLILHANDFKHQDSYAYVLKQGDTVLEKDEYIGVTKEGESFPYLSFSLKHGQSITFIGLPTAVYTVEELSPPLGYYSTHSPGKDVTLTEDASVTVDVTNNYAPADLEISKTVVEVETGNLPEVQDFLFKVVYTGEETLPGSYTYTVSGTKDGQETRTVDVAGKQFNFTLKKGETAYFHNLPTGAYTVEEEDYAARGYKTSYTLGTGGEQTTGRTTNVELERGEVTRVHFTNEFPVGDLQIKKTVAKEFYGTAWTGDTFWFTVQRTDRDLTPGYKYKVSLGEDYPDTEAVVGEDKKLKISIPFDSDDAEALKAADTSVAHLLTIESLPAGTYVVNEAETPDYVQSDRDIEALAVPNNPVAEFTNTLKLPKGSLYLAKELIPAEGYEGDLDKDKVFTFTIKAVTAVPASATVDVSVNGGEPEARAMGAEGLTVTVKANQNVIISNLPVGTYRIIEATEPQYANKFAQAESPAGPWEPLVSSSIDGCLYTDVTVEKAERTHVLCTNVYPVNTAKLILHKKITNRQPQDPVPGDSFVFTVTLDKLTKDYITYQIFDESGTKVGADRTADVTDGSFTLSLSDGQYAVIAYLPVSSCTVTETGNAAYDTSYRVYLYGVDVPVPMPPDTTDMETEVSENGTSVTRELAAGTTELMIFENRRKATITYHSNYPTDLNQTDVMVSYRKTFGVDYTIEDASIGETTFEAEGYVLDSWNTKADGSGTAYKPGEVYQNNNDLTLYAQWIDKRIADGVKVYVGINMSYYMTENQDFYYTLPEEPAVINLKGIRAHNHKDGNGGYYWEIDLTNWDDALAGEPTDFIRPEIMNPGVLVGNPNNPNENVVGVFDPDGEDTRALLYFTDEDYYGEKGIVAAWIAVRNDLKTKYPSDIYWDLLSDDPDDFEVIPYVIKYHGRNYSTTDLAWFIDMIIVPKARFSVKYEINLEDGYEATIPQDKNLYGENYFVNIKATDSTAVNQNDSRYVAKFKEWIATDENGKIIPIDTQHNRFTMPASNVILTAQWEYPVKYTVEYYKKDPISGDYVHQTKDDEEKVVYIGETAEYDDQKYSGFHFEKVEPTDLKIKEDNQVFKVYYDPNTLTISQTGLKEKESAMYRVQGNGIDMYVEIQGNKSVTIEQIPLGDYTVTELTDWTWKYDSDAESAASAKPVTVTPDGPNEVEFAFTTNNPDWLGGENAKNNKFASTPILQP